MSAYVNYHSHKMFSNILVCDSPTKYEEYINRAIELNQTVITSVEHGTQGNYWLLNEMIKIKNIELMKRRDAGEENVPKCLKFVFGTEAYWVKNRLEKDKSNCHIIILAKTEFGRRKINLALSQANMDGVFNGRPRLDLELLLTLPKDDVFVTSACLAYWNKYDDIDEITLKLKNHFGDNFMLEVQNHNTSQQRDLNKHILELSSKYNIKIIAGMDSHYINPEDSSKRDIILKYKGITYEDEQGWYLDYPSYEEAVERFRVQGILSEEEIRNAMINTNIVETFDDVDLGLKIIKNGKEYFLDTEIKVPTLYPNKTQEERDTLFKSIINKEWVKFANEENIPKEEYPMYLEGIRYEVGEIITSKMTDYFLLHYVGLKNGVDKYGGLITKRGRGSAVSYFVNTLLGFSKVDRFKCPIKLYPERFLTSDKILKAKVTPDIDNNIAEQEPFVKAFKELLGEHSIYPMIAFGTLQKSSAIKLYMGAEDIPATTQNEVSKQLKEYETEIKHCENDEDKLSVDISKYISKDYIHYVEDSKPYQGVVVQKTPHPCAHLLLDTDIREEIGLYRCTSSSSRESVLTAFIEGSMADHYKYLKTDLLIVDVVGLTEAIWNRIGMKSPTNSQLENMLKTEDKGRKAWDIYANGLTLCVNQCEQEGTRNKCKKYKMKNTAELSSFVSAVRPGFASQISKFLAREPYSNGVKEVDALMKETQHFMLFQESLMSFLNWLDIPMKETNNIIKKISKKVYTHHPEQMEELKEKCKPTWLKKVGTLEGFDEIFKIVELSGQYIFVAAHAYCVGLDGAEIAYCKANHPYETYEVCLNWFDKKKNKDKVSALKKEMYDGFGINVGDIKWGLDNRKFTADKENNYIYPTLTSIKGMGKGSADELYSLSQENVYNNFLDLLKDIKNKTSVNSSMLLTLIKLGYFSQYGKAQKLIDIVDLYNSIYNKKQFKKEKLPIGLSLDILGKYSKTETNKTIKDIDIDSLLDFMIGNIPNNELGLFELLKTQVEMLGYIDYKNDNIDKRYVLITDVNTKYTPIINTHCIGTGNTCKCKISKPIFRNQPLEVNNIIYIHKMKSKFGCKKVGDKTLKNGTVKPIFEEDPTTKVWWIEEYSIIKDLDEALKGDN